MRRRPAGTDYLNIWIPSFQWMRMSERPDGRTIGCVITGQGATYAAIAVETASAADLQGVLDSHAHKLVGQFSSLEEAQAACEAFASEWVQASAAAACPCPELVVGRTKQAASSRRPGRTKQAARAATKGRA